MTSARGASGRAAPSTLPHTLRTTPRLPTPTYSPAPAHRGRPALPTLRHTLRAGTVAAHTALQPRPGAMGRVALRQRGWQRSRRDRTRGVESTDIVSVRLLPDLPTYLRIGERETDQEVKAPVER